VKISKDSVRKCDHLKEKGSVLKNSLLEDVRDEVGWGTKAVAAVSSLCVLLCSFISYRIIPAHTEATVKYWHTRGETAFALLFILLPQTVSTILNWISLWMNKSLTPHPQHELSALNHQCRWFNLKPFPLENYGNCWLNRSLTDLLLSSDEKIHMNKFTLWPQIFELNQVIRISKVIHNFHT